MRTLAAATPPQWQPPRQWVPPAHVPADSSTTLSYHATYWIKQSVGLAITLAVAVAIGALAVCGIFSDFRRKTISEARTSDSQAVDRTAGTRFQSNLLQGPGAVELLTKYQAKLGSPIHAVELTMHATHASLTAQDPKHPDQLGRYSYQEGTVGAGSPEPSARYRGSLARHLFKLEDLPLARLPTLVTEATAALGFEQGEPSHVIIRRGGGSVGGVTIRVYARNDRHSGSVEFDGTGKLRKVYQ